MKPLARFRNMGAIAALRLGRRLAMAWVANQRRIGWIAWVAKVDDLATKASMVPLAVMIGCFLVVLSSLPFGLRVDDPRLLFMGMAGGVFAILAILPALMCDLVASVHRKLAWAGWIEPIKPWELAEHPYIEEALGNIQMHQDANSRCVLRFELKILHFLFDQEREVYRMANHLDVHTPGARGENPRPRL